MDVLGAGQVELNLSRTQFDEERQVRDLASGLRVNSASDDPSGYAIAENLQTQVSGMQQAVQNVQTANNMLSTADGVLNNVQLILQRIRGLIVESRSDLNSAGDLKDIQDEIDQLLQQINKMAGNTKFNGITLFDGSHDTSAGTGNAIKQVGSVLATQGGNSGSTNVTNADGLGDPGPLITLLGAGIPPTGYFVPAYMEFQITGYDPNAIDPDSGLPVGPGVYLKFSAYSTDPSLGAAPVYTDTTAVPVSTGSIPSTYIAPSGAGDLIDFQVANLTAADVGTSVAFETTLGKTQTPGTAIQVNDQGNEGTVVSVSLPTLSANALNLSGLSVEAADQINYLNTDIGSTGSNSLVAGAAEQRVDDAMDQIGQARAQLGAQMVSLNENASDVNIQIVNQTASESSIRDANIAQTATAFTKDQILAQVGTSVLSQMQLNANLVLQLFTGQQQSLNKARA